ncbi:hypothetical protein B0T18DRAFT_394936 [Schizothecium vesticola]|uniref:Uncharacterized protein n=1 Tax=Schizothecium vesticola TaxID=314040 RepID=A0AA40EHS0_9PEZI|nr:hypothetical protein B0T18DRAFT_394936 [Schizothecium vesticola]
MLQADLNRKGLTSSSNVPNPYTRFCTDAVNLGSSQCLGFAIPPRTCPKTGGRGWKAWVIPSKSRRRYEQFGFHFSPLHQAAAHGHLDAKNMVFITTQALAHELYDETQFQKTIVAGLQQVGNGVYDGLFTAQSDAPN